MVSSQDGTVATARGRIILSDRNALATSKVQQLAQDESKASQGEKLTQLTAPVAGTIQQLAVNSVGGVVTPAQPLMIVVLGGGWGEGTSVARCYKKRSFKPRYLWGYK